VPSFTLTRRQTLTVVALALVAIFAAAHFLGGTSGGGGASAPAVASSADVPPLTVPAAGASAPASASPAAPLPVAQSPVARSPDAATALVVDVAGAVRRPGLYRLPQGSRIADAIARAGGMSRHAARAAVNLAAPLADGEQVLVPSGTGGAIAAGASGAPSPTAPVDLNTATVEQLDALPGIGPVTAQKIVDYRTQNGPFTSVDDLDAIPGIGPARIENLRGLVIA
jgi:competence protein ComEA